MWEQIEFNRRRSRVVIASMGVLLVATGAAVGGLLGGGDPFGSSGIIGALVALGIWLVLWLITTSQGDSIMLSMAGARRIQKKDHPRLFNIVEEMTIASSLGKMPAVYVVDDPSPNAFATGRDPTRAAVAVTTGLLERLDRDELQGVVAHEIGHIKNRDVALMTTAGIMVGAIALIADVGRRALWYGGGQRRSRSDNNQGQALMMVIAVVLLILAPIIAHFVYLALSRRREYLADASGAYFTRYPDGLANALEKIGAAPATLTNQSAVTAPMYISSPRRASGASSTHPPIKERVRILRGMGGRADFGAYEVAYKQARNSSAIGKKTLEKAEEVPARGPLGDWDEDFPERHREASNAFLLGSGYEMRPCPSCGAVLKAPPETLARMRTCPRCQAVL